MRIMCPFVLKIESMVKMKAAWRGKGWYGNQRNIPLHRMASESNPKMGDDLVSGMDLEYAIVLSSLRCPKPGMASYDQTTTSAHVFYHILSVVVVVTLSDVHLGSCG